MSGPHVIVSAPGKLMLFGEYAVLDGAPAILTAVDRRVRIEGHFDASPGDETYGLDDETPFSLRTESGGWGCSNPLVDAVLRTLATEGDTLAGWRWLADTQAAKSAASPTDEKLGVGSSAASCVALVTAFRAAVDADADATFMADAMVETAFDAHRSFQNGRGSGADVATSALGGTVVYRLVDDRPHAARLGPVPLYWRAVWTGASADTREFIAAIEQLRDRSPGTWRELMGSMRKTAVAAADAVARGATDELFELVELANADAAALGDAARVPIVTEAHDALVKAAGAAGLAAKISGAGGGDLSLVFGRDPMAVNAFVERLDHRSLSAVDPRPDDAGVRVRRA